MFFWNILYSKESSNETTSIVSVGKTESFTSFAYK